MVRKFYEGVADLGSGGYEERGIDVNAKSYHTQWVYEIISIYRTIYASELNNFGKRGWELVGITNNNGNYEYYFKKPLNKTP